MMGVHELRTGRQRPRTRGECQDVPRPCPWASCHYHLWPEQSEDRRGRCRQEENGTLGYPLVLDPENMGQTCALDVADGGGATLEEVGDLLRLTRERIRQIEVQALRKLRARLELSGMAEDLREMLCYLDGLCHVSSSEDAESYMLTVFQLPTDASEEKEEGR